MDEFGGDIGIVGHGISVGHKPYTVIGVMPREFGVGIWGSYLVGSYDGSYEGMWVPRVPSPPGALNREAGPIIIARLKKDATLAQANAQLQPLSARFAAAYRAGAEGLKLYARSLEPGIDGQVRTVLLILLGAVGFVLLMACVNVTSLLVARSWTRQRELAIRKALGATRLRILRQLLAKSLLLALAGGALGLFLSVWSGAVPGDTVPFSCSDDFQWQSDSRMAPDICAAEKGTV
jgi:putative ABC transport system permease protein